MPKSAQLLSLAKFVFLMYILLFQKMTSQNSCGGDLRASPHNFLAVGAIAPIASMESAPMIRVSIVVNELRQL